MRVCLFTEPHRGATYADQLRLARHAEELGFDALLPVRPLPVHGRRRAARPHRRLDRRWPGWAGRPRGSGWARWSTRPRSGCPGRWRSAWRQVDQMSGGRVELGLGAGWFEREHTAYGIPFPPLGERFDRLEEQLAIVTGLWATPAGETFSYDGEHYRAAGLAGAAEAGAAARPADHHRWPRRQAHPGLAARYADEFNMPFTTVAETAAAFTRVRAAAQRHGRTLRLSAGVVVALGRTDAEARRRRPAARAERPAAGGSGGRYAGRAGAADRRARRDRRDPRPSPRHRPGRPRPRGSDRLRGTPPGG